METKNGKLISLTKPEIYRIEQLEIDSKNIYNNQQELIDSIQRLNVRIEKLEVDSNNLSIERNKQKLRSARDRKIFTLSIVFVLSFWLWHHFQAEKTNKQQLKHQKNLELITPNKLKRT